MMDIQNTEDLIADNQDPNDYSRGRLLRKQKINKNICAKDERNASIRKVCWIQILQNVTTYFFRYNKSFKKQKMIAQLMTYKPSDNIPMLSKK